MHPHLQVKHFNGIPVRNLRHLAEMVIACQEQYMNFQMDLHELVVLETQEALQATPEVGACSGCLLALLEIQVAPVGAGAEDGFPTLVVH